MMCYSNNHISPLPKICYLLIIRMFELITEDNRTSCKSTCNGQFKRCVGGLKNRKNRYGKLNGCSGAYTACLSNLNNSNNMYNLTPDCAVKCKPTTTMAALKSKC